MQKKKGFTYSYYSFRWLAFTPKEVIDEAFKNKVSIIAIADHDTVDAYNDKLFEYARSKNIKTNSCS